MGGAFMA